MFFRSNITRSTVLNRNLKYVDFVSKLFHKFPAVMGGFNSEDFQLRAVHTTFKTENFSPLKHNAGWAQCKVCQPIIRAFLKIQNEHGLFEKKTLIEILDKMKLSSVQKTVDILNTAGRRQLANSGIGNIYGIDYRKYGAGSLFVDELNKQLTNFEQISARMPVLFIQQLDSSTNPALRSLIQRLKEAQSNLNNQKAEDTTTNSLKTSAIEINEKEDEVGSGVQKLTDNKLGQMDALRYDPDKKRLELIQVPIPQITDPRQVLIEIAYAGVSRTDLNIIEENVSRETNEPVTLGHEFCGTVLETGSGVSAFRKGDRVVIEPNSGCRNCEYCRRGQPQLCSAQGFNNFTENSRGGAWANYALVADHQIYRLPDNISFEQAMFSELVSRLVHGIDIINPIHIGQKILVLGAGVTGRVLASMLHLQGHKKVIISEPREERMIQMKKLGLGDGYNLLTPKQLYEKYLIYNKYKFDMIMDCCESPEAIQQGIKLLKPGGKLCIFGVAPPSSKITIVPYDLFSKEISIFGLNTNSHAFSKAMDYIAAMGDKYLNYDKLGVKVYELDKFEKAFEELKDDKISKAVFSLRQKTIDSDDELEFDTDDE